MPSPPNSIIDSSPPNNIHSAGGNSVKHRPASVANDRPNDLKNGNSKQAPPRPPIRSNFELEPNPFEQSFSVSSSSLSSLRHGADQKQDPSPSSSENKSNSSDSMRDSSPSRRQSMSNTSGHPNGDTPKPVLPPLASITSPSDPSYAWAFSSADLTNSLRAGPLSPAMLAGPQHQPTTTSQPASSIAALAASAGSMHPPLFGFDPSGSFRTGLTPSTGLTPLVGGPVSFPPPSPNTAAFLAMVNSGAAGSAAAATITPNTLNALAGVLQQSAAATQSTNQQTNGVSNGNNAANANGNNSTNGSTSTTQGQSVAPASVAPLQVAAPASTTYQNGTANSQSRTSNNNNYSDAAGAASHAANGLFLLSQAHQELTKREEAQKQSMAQAAAGNGAGPGGSAAKGSSAQSQSALQPSTNGTSSAKRGSKRKAETASVTSNVSVKPDPSKKSKASSTSSRGSTARRGSTVSNQDFDEGEDDDDSDEEQQKPAHSTNNKQNKKPETEEEKRRNFLERNRQAALKCRQRKKQWLAQLQARNEFLQNENERLTALLVASREEISRLSQLVGGAGVGLTSGVVPMVGVAGMGVQQQQVHQAPFMAHQQQHHPIAVPVSLAPGSTSSIAATAASPPTATKTSPHTQHHHAQQQQQHSPNLRSPTSDGRSSRSSFRDVRDYANGATSVSGVRENGTREYARDMREREMGHIHGHAPQAVAVNGRTYGY